MKPIALAAMTLNEAETVWFYKQKPPPDVIIMIYIHHPWSRGWKVWRQMSSLDYHKRDMTYWAELAKKEHKSAIGLCVYQVKNDLPLPVGPSGHGKGNDCSAENAAGEGINEGATK